MSRPVAALAWKEWREQRPIVLAGMLLSMVLPLILLAGMEAAGRSWTFGSVVHALPAVNVLIVWPLLAVIAGSTTISNEMAEGTLGFILSRPVARRTVWLMKVIFGCLSVIVVALTSVMVFSFCRFLLTGAFRGRPIESLIHLISGMDLPIELLLACIFFVFASGVFFSTFMTRALTAAAGGLLLSLLVLPALFVLWTRIDTDWEFEAGLLGFQICLATLLTLIASLYLFTRNVERSRTGRSLAVGMVMILGGLVLISAPIVWAHIRVTPETAYLDSAYLRPHADRVLVEVTAERSLTKQVWAIPLGGSEVTRLTARHAHLQSVSPDGRWIVYLSNRGIFGLRSNRYSLRIARTDGSDDRLVSDDVSIDDDFFVWLSSEFSPDGKRLAWIEKGSLKVMTVETSELRTIRLQEASCKKPSVFGWTEGSKEVIVSSREGCLIAVNPESGHLRSISEHDQFSWILWNFQEDGFRHLPLLFNDYERDALTLVLVDVESGQEKRLTMNACFGGDMSLDGRVFGFGICKQNGEWYSSEFRVLDIESDQERSLGTIQGRAWDFHLSPSRRAMAARYKETNEEKEPKTVVLANGEVLRRLELWMPVGWEKTGKLVVSDPEAVRFAIADVNEGQIEKTFP